MITFQPVTWDNIGDVIDLEMNESQEDFLAPNVFGIAQAYVAWMETGHQPVALAILSDGNEVGFALLECRTKGLDEYKDNQKPFYYLGNYMIDKNHQGKGLGKAALLALFDYLRTNKPLAEAASIYLSYEPNNAVARKTFASVGFMENGEMEDGDDIVAKLVL